MGRVNEIIVLPFFGTGHLFPCMELCKHLASRHFHSTLLISSDLSANVPSSLRNFPGVEVVEEASVVVPPLPPPGVESDLSGFRRHHQQMGAAIEALLSGRVKDDSSTLPVCAVLDNMMSWSKDIFRKFGVPTVAIFTSGACSAALEYGAWKSKVADLKQGETRFIPGMPEEMGITYLETKRKSHRGPGGLPCESSPPSLMGPIGVLGTNGHTMRPPGAGGPKEGKFGPPKPGQQPPWIDEMEGLIGLFVNTCDELEGPFLKYLAEKTEKPVWGVGPLLPEDYWRSAGVLLRDEKIRPKKQSNFSEEEVIQWMDSKPAGSVLYVSFGSEVGPTSYGQLAEALAESEQPFISMIQPNSGWSGPPPPLMGQKPDTDAFSIKVDADDSVILPDPPALIFPNPPAESISVGDFNYQEWSKLTLPLCSAIVLAFAVAYFEFRGNLPVIIQVGMVFIALSIALCWVSLYIGPKFPSIARFLSQSGSFLAVTVIVMFLTIPLFPIFKFMVWVIYGISILVVVVVFLVSRWKKL